MEHAIGKKYVVDMHPEAYKNLSASCGKAFDWGSGSFGADRYMGMNNYQ